MKAKMAKKDFVDDILKFYIKKVNIKIIDKINKEYIQNGKRDLIKVSKANNLGPLVNWLTNSLVFKKKMKKKKPLLEELEQNK